MQRRDLWKLLSLGAGSSMLPAMLREARAAVPTLKFRELYIKGDELTDLAKSLNGKTVRMTGYMAPPLKPEVRFFVLTKLPMSVCPFCESEAQWPDDLVVAYCDDAIDVVRYTDLIDVEGKLELGFWKDPETQFVSLIRITGATYVKR